jgi:NADPH:quinone reductase-like Zn-dependent oxidoreductase
MADLTTIRALALEGFDRPPAVIDVPAPVPAAGEVLVHVRAASVNAYDTFVAMGMMKDYLPYGFPVVLGQDVSGVVVAAGSDVEGFRENDKVFGTIGMKSAVHEGTFAELAVPQAAQLAVTPEGVDDLQAGSLGVAGTTAMSAVEALAPIEGATVLVVGATGGVGTFAIQLAALRGAHPIASVRPGDEFFVADLRAADTVDYTADLPGAVLERYPGGVDAVIDLVNRDPGAFALIAGLVRDGGRAVSAVGGAGDATRIGNVTVANIGGNPAYLTPLAEMVADGRLRAAVQRTYPLEDAAQALVDFTEGHTLGKLVISVADA